MNAVLSRLLSFLNAPSVGAIVFRAKLEDFSIGFYNRRIENSRARNRKVLVLFFSEPTLKTLA